MKRYLYSKYQISLTFAKNISIERYPINNATIYSIKYALSGDGLY